MPTYVEAYVNRGNAKKASKDYEGALADYNKALEIDPNNLRAYDGRRNILK